MLGSAIDLGRHGLRGIVAGLEPTMNANRFDGLFIGYCVEKLACHAWQTHRQKLDLSDRP